MQIISFFSFNLFRMLFLVCSVLYITSCSQGKTENNTGSKKGHYVEPNGVETMILRRTAFVNEIVSNGKLKALRKSDLKFKVGGEMKQLNVQNGNSIQAGTIIAVLDQFEYRQRLEQAETSLKKAAIDLQDELLGYYGGRVNKDSISPAIYEGAAIRSGYTSASRELKTAQFNFEGTILRAPFNGKIANIKHKTYEQISSGEVFCTIIDDTEFEVEFHLIESEIKHIATQNRVKVVPIANDEIFYGAICEINPLVEENGLVLVKAKIKNNGELWAGMNVTVVIEKEVADQLVVPKSAVVIRQNQEVIFKYIKGRAFWTYVQTGLESSTSYSVIADPEKGGVLEEGDTIIITDNLNLAHDNPVVIKRSHVR